MTSQILIPDGLSMPIASDASDPKPFQSNCQTELRYLQAETAALLQQLQTLKQQRLAATEATGDRRG